MFRDVAAAEPQWRTILLRYFNPVGAHPSGRVSVAAAGTCVPLAAGLLHGFVVALLSLQVLQGRCAVHAMHCMPLTAPTCMHAFAGPNQGIHLRPISLPAMQRRPIGGVHSAGKCGDLFLCGMRRAGQIGEHPVGIPNNLMPFVQQVALGQRPQLSVFGSDYPTRDGTCVASFDSKPSPFAALALQYSSLFSALGPKCSLHM